MNDFKLTGPNLYIYAEQEAKGLRAEPISMYMDRLSSHLHCDHIAQYL